MGTSLHQVEERLCLVAMTRIGLMACEHGILLYLQTLSYEIDVVTLKRIYLVGLCWTDKVAVERRTVLPLEEF